VERIVAAAERALGVALIDPVDLGGSDRTAVLRCTVAPGPAPLAANPEAAAPDSAANAPDPDAPGSGALGHFRAAAGPAVAGDREDRVAAGPTSVVVKAYLEGQASATFATEAAGLSLLNGGTDRRTGARLSIVVPALLAVDPSFPLIVLSDLGTGDSLADLLLGSRPGPAQRALLGWAAGCGKLAIATAHRQEELTRLRARFDGDHRWPTPDSWRERTMLAMPEALGHLGLSCPDGLRVELDELIEATDARRYPVFSPGDLCPDNNLTAADGLALLDFEGAGFHSVFLDAAYTRLPFATCWCVYRLPPDLAATMEAIYRGAVSQIHPDLTDDAIWSPGVRLAGASWVASMTGLLLERAVGADRSMHPRAPAAPGMRQVLRYRWSYLRGELAGTGELPHLSTTLAELMAATEDWPSPDLPVYPALAAGTGGGPA